MEPHRGAPAWYRDPALYAATGLGLALRAGLLVPYGRVSGSGDEVLHYTFGVLASYFGSAVFGQWGPLYDGLIATLFWIGEPDPLRVRLVQVALSTGTIPLVYAIARANGSRRAGGIAALLFACDPTLVAFTHYLFSETLFITLLLCAVSLLFRGRERSGWELVAAGLFFGLTILTRSVALYFLILWPFWELLRGRRRAAGEAALVFAIALAVVLPWTVRNALKYHDFLLVDGTLGRTAYLAFSDAFFNPDHGFVGAERLFPTRKECPGTPAPGAPPIPPPRELEGLFAPGFHGLLRSGDPGMDLWRAWRFATEDLPGLQRCELERAFAFARENPGTMARHGIRRFHSFWGPNSHLLHAVATGTYADGPLAREHYAGVKWLVVALHVLVGATALLLFGRRRVPELARWCAAFIAYYTAIHVVSVAYSRYRLPVMPLVMILSSLWLAAPTAPEGTGRRIAVAAGVTAFLALCLHYVAVRLP